MSDLKRGFAVFVLFTAVLSLFNFGCVSAQKANRIDELESQVGRLEQLIAQKDAQIAGLQESLNNLENQLSQVEQAYQAEQQRLLDEINRLKQGSSVPIPIEPNANLK